MEKYQVKKSEKLLYIYRFQKLRIKLGVKKKFEVIRGILIQKSEKLRDKLSGGTKNLERDFPGGPAVRILPCQYRGLRLNSWPGH